MQTIGWCRLTSSAARPRFAGTDRLQIWRELGGFGRSRLLAPPLRRTGTRQIPSARATWRIATCPATGADIDARHSNGFCTPALGRLGVPVATGQHAATDAAPPRSRVALHPLNGVLRTAQHSGYAHSPGVHAHSCPHCRASSTTPPTYPPVPNPPATLDQTALMSPEARGYHPNKQYLVARNRSAYGLEETSKCCRSSP